MLIYTLVQAPVVSVMQSYRSNDRGGGDNEVFPTFT